MKSEICQTSPFAERVRSNGKIALIHGYDRRDQLQLFLKGKGGGGKTGIGGELLDTADVNIASLTWRQDLLYLQLEAPYALTGDGYMQYRTALRGDDT